MTIKRFISSIVVAILVLSNIQIGFADSVSSGHDSRQVHLMVMHQDDAQMGDTDCCHDEIGCDLQGLCGAHLCYVLQPTISVEMNGKEQTALTYQNHIGSIQIRLKDRPPKLLIL